MPIEFMSYNMAVPVKAAVPEFVRVRHCWGEAVSQVSSPICLLLAAGQGQLHTGLSLPHDSAQNILIKKHLHMRVLLNTL